MYIFSYECIYSCMYVFLCAMYVCIYVYLLVCNNICIYVCNSVCMYVYKLLCVVYMYLCVYRSIMVVGFMYTYMYEIMYVCVYTRSVRNVSDLSPGKRNWLTWSVGHLITREVVPLGLHTLLPAVPPLLEACRKSLFRNGV